MTNPFSWDYLTAPIADTPTFGPFSIFYLVLFAVVFLGSAFFVRDAPKRFADHKLKRDMVIKGATILMWEAGVGLFFFLIRAVRIELISFERRIWLYLCFLVLVATIAYFVYYLRVKYPPMLAEFERRRERRKYVQPASSSAPKARRSGSKARRQRVRS